MSPSLALLVRAGSQPRARRERERERGARGEPASGCALQLSKAWSARQWLPSASFPVCLGLLPRCWMRKRVCRHAPVRVLASAADEEGEITQRQEEKMDTRVQRLRMRIRAATDMREDGS